MSRLNTREKARAAAGGFTLVEIAIVVLIIGLLAAIAFPSFKKARTSVQRTKALQDLRVLSGAIDLLAMDTGKWPGGISLPGDQETWDLSTPAAGLLSCNSSFGSFWKGPYLKKVPLDPWGMPYFFDPDYTIDGKACPVVGSFGPNRVGQNLYDSDDIYVRMDK